jgi:hypothetical protein
MSSILDMEIEVRKIELANSADGVVDDFDAIGKLV